MSTSSIAISIATPVASPLTAGVIESITMTSADGVSSTGVSVYTVQVPSSYILNSTTIAVGGLSFYTSTTTDLSGGAIAGIVVGLIAIVGLLGLLVFWFLFIRNRQQRAETQKKGGPDHGRPRTP